MERALSARSLSLFLSVCFLAAATASAKSPSRIFKEIEASAARGAHRAELASVLLKKCVQTIPVETCLMKMGRQECAPAELDVVTCSLEEARAGLVHFYDTMERLSRALGDVLNGLENYQRATKIPLPSQVSVGSLESAWQTVYRDFEDLERRVPYPYVSNQEQMKGAMAGDEIGPSGKREGLSVRSIQNSQEFKRIKEAMEFLARGDLASKTPNAAVPVPKFSGRDNCVFDNLGCRAMGGRHWY